MELADNIFEKAVLEMKAEELNVELKSMGWHLFGKSNLTLERQERVLGCAEGEYEFATIRGALVKLFPDTIVSQETRSVPDRKPSDVSDQKPNDRSRTDFANLVMGSQGVSRPTKLMHVTQRKIQTPRRKSRVKKEADLTAAFEREMDELASVVEELEDTSDVQDVEDLRELSESMYEGLATIRETHAKLREKTMNRGYQPSSPASSYAAFGSRQSSLSGSGRGKGKMRAQGGSA